MNIELIWVGTTKEKRIKTLCEDYIKRIGFNFPVKSIAVKEDTSRTKYTGEHIIDRECKKLSGVLNGNYYNIALHPEGTMFSSENFADFIENKMISGCKGISFIVGGDLGLSKDFLKNCDFVLSLSAMTFTHEMTRMILCEQIYRALTIIHGSSYHK